MGNGECNGGAQKRTLGSGDRTWPCHSALRTPHSALVFHLYFLTSSGTFSGVTLSRKSSSTSTGVANPQAPRHSTSLTVHLPSGLVAPSSLAPVASSKAWTTASAPQMLQGDVVHTCTKCLPTGCW